MAFDMRLSKLIFFRRELSTSGITRWFNIAFRLEYRPGIVLEHVWSLRDRYQALPLEICTRLRLLALAQMADLLRSKFQRVTCPLTFQQPCPFFLEVECTAESIPELYFFCRNIPSTDVSLFHIRDVFIRQNHDSLVLLN